MPYLGLKYIFEKVTKCTGIFTSNSGVVKYKMVSIQNILVNAYDLFVLKKKISKLEFRHFLLTTGFIFTVE